VQLIAIEMIKYIIVASVVTVLAVGAKLSRLPPGGKHLDIRKKQRAIGVDLNPSMQANY
jgi:hypothetical protein